MTFPGELGLWKQYFDLIFRHCPVVYQKKKPQQPELHEVW